MVIYISMIRGINVGKQKRIEMQDLKDLYRSLGFNNVKTYIQSGNLIFQFTASNTSVLAKKIAQEIKKAYNFDVDVLVLTKNELKKVIDNNPFKDDKSRLYITFLGDNLLKNHDINAISNEINRVKDESEDFLISKTAVYLFCPNGYGRTKLSNNFFEKKLHVTATTRNWNTVTKLYAFAANQQ